MRLEALGGQKDSWKFAPNARISLKLPFISVIQAMLGGQETTRLESETVKRSGTPRICAFSSCVAVVAVAAWCGFALMPAVLPHARGSVQCTSPFNCLIVVSRAQARLARRKCYPTPPLPHDAQPNPPTPLSARALQAHPHAPTRCTTSCFSSFRFSRT